MPCGVERESGSRAAALVALGGCLIALALLPARGEQGERSLPAD
jgi:hypothetical protein